MDFQSPGKGLRFSASVSLQTRNRNLSVPWRCPVSDRLWQYRFPYCAIKTDRVMAINLNIYFSLRPGDVMSAWHIRCIITHPQLYIFKICCGWHQSFIAKSSGQIVINTHKYTRWKHDHLALAGDEYILVLAIDQATVKLYSWHVDTCLIYICRESNNVNFRV